MQMATDDEVHTVNDVFLGFSHFSLPWRARYRAYGIWAVIYALILVILIRTEFMAFWPAVYGLVFSIYLTQKLMNHISHELSVRQMITAFIHEVRAPRKLKEKVDSQHSMSLTDIKRTK